MVLEQDPIELCVKRVEDRRRQKALGALYDGAVRYQDRRLGELLRSIDAALGFDHTLLIITSDHGENLGECGRWDHAFMINEALLRVPLIIRYPGRSDAGQRLAGFCQPVDLLPTVFDVAGLGPLPANVQGGSLRPGRFEAREFAFAEEWPLLTSVSRLPRWLGHKTDLSPLLAHWRSVRDGRYKLVWSSDGRHQLYDLQVDPLETMNRIGEEPAAAQRLGQALAAWREATPRYVPRNLTPTVEQPDEEALRQLRTLGYAP
jgi:arylsulfatase A-like enzyme